MESVEQLAARRDQLASHATDLDGQIAQQTHDAVANQRDAGAILVAQRQAWVSAEYAGELATIDQLAGQIDQVDSQLADISGREHQGLGGFFKRFGDRQSRLGLVKQRDQLATQVAAALQSLGEKAPQKTVPEAGTLLADAQSQLAQVAHMQGQRQAIQAELASLTDEITRRREAISKLGFDALWSAAWLQKNEPPAIATPVALKRGEVAWLSLSAVLSRQATRTQWTGSSQGFSFPILHTGVRYRVGSFRGHPIQTSTITDLDSGNLVLTSHRLVFVGRLKSVTVDLAHIVHVEAYTDALGVFQDRRETPDYFKLTTPQYMLFYINYALERLK